MSLSPVVSSWVAILSIATFSVRAQIPAPAGGSSKSPWLDNFQDALKKAEAEKKPVLLDITTDWCGWSKKMETETFATSAVQRQLRSFVLVRINPEASEENQKIAESFGADSYPTFVVVNYQGEDIASQSGYLENKDFLEFLRRYLPMFENNPLGYKRVQLAADDSLLKAVQRIPAPDSRPTSVGSFVVLDECAIRIQADGAAKYLSRSATFVSDPERGDLPSAVRRYTSSRQKAKFKSVRILNLKGEGREVDVKQAKDEHAYSNQNVYWDVRTLSLSLPHLKEGQILDVIEEVETEPIMPGQFFFRWYTGLKILLTSDLKITFPSTLKLQQRAFRCREPVKETRNGDGTITWSLQTSCKDIFEPVVFSPPVYELWEGYEFSTPCTRDAVAQWFTSLCQGRDSLPDSAKRTLADLKRTNTNQTALLQAIMDWVAKDVRYVSVALGASTHQPHPVKETLANRYGDCKDQSLLVQALCREAGIPASLVLLDASGAGFDENSPSMDNFNHCIVEVRPDGRSYCVDPAAGKSTLGRLPRSYAGSKALKLENTIGSVLTLPSYEPELEAAFDETVIKLNPNGSATLTSITRLSGERAMQWKEQMKSTTSEKIRKYLEDSYKESGRKLVDFFMTDPNSDTNQCETRISFTVPRFGSRTAGGLVFKLGSSSDGDWTDELDQPRTQPFKFYATDTAHLRYVVELPSGAVLKGTPEDVNLDTPFLRATRKTELKDNRLSLEETSRLFEARLEASEAVKIAAAFRQLRDHRDYSFVVQMPTAR